MKNTFKIATMSCLMFLTACASNGLNTPVVVPADCKISHPPLPRQVENLPVNFSIYNAQKLQAFQQSHPNGSLIVIDSRNYKNLATNLAEQARYVQQLRAVVDSYKNVK